MTKYLIAAFILLILVFAWGWIVGGRLERAERRTRSRQTRQMDRDVDQLIRMDRKSDAIRVYRALHGVDEKTAQAAVEKRAGSRAGRS